NLFSMGQQFWVLKKFPPPKTATAGAGAKGARPAGRPGQGKPAGAGRPAAKSPGIGRISKAAAERLNARRGEAKTAGATEPAVDRKALAPKPGAKPVNPKKGGARAKRPAR